MTAADLRGAWTALKDDLTARIDSDLAIAESFGPDHGTGVMHYALASANRATIAKMRELEAAAGNTRE